MADTRIPSILILGAMASLVALTGCGPKFSVHHGYDTDVDFSGYETFDWVLDPQRSGDPRADNTFVNTRVRQAVEDELNAMGFQADATGAADMLLNYMLMVDDRLDATTFHNYADTYYNTYYDVPYYAPDWQWGSTTIVTEYSTGTLVIDILDRQEEVLIWRGVAETEIRAPLSASKKEKRIREAVARILTEFPPGPAKK